MKASVWASRCAALAILIGVVTTIWIGMLQPLVVTFFDHRESLRQSQEMLAKYEKLNASREQSSKVLQQLRSVQESEGRLFMGGSSQLVGADIQNSLKKLIEASSGKLVSMQMLPVREEGGFRRIPMAVSLRATLESLEPILYAIEAHSPYLFIEVLEVNANRGLIDSSPDSQEANELQVRFEVYGYMSIEAS